MKVVINSGNNQLNFKELWSYRELFSFLVWRDILVRYKQTALGVVWAILQPLLITIIFSVFFNRIAGISSGKVPYVIFAYVGLLFWNYFSTALSDISNSLITNQSIVTKVFFPRLIIPAAAAGVAVLDFVSALIMLAILLIYYHVIPALIGIVWIPVLLLLSIVTALGIGLTLAILNVKYRDVRYALPFFVQSLLFITPVIYPVSLVPQQWQWALFINPMTGVVETARAALFNLSINYSGLAISLISALIMVFVGITLFQRFERQIADVL